MESKLEVAGGIGELSLEGELSIEGAAELKALLVHAMKEAEDLTVDPKGKYRIMFDSG